MAWFALYTAHQKETSIAGRLALLGAVEEVFLPRVAPTPGVSELLFPNYVFLRVPAGEVEELLPALLAIDGVRRLVGAEQRRPSPIAEHDLEVLRELCRGDSAPALGPIPANGRLARITRGPMAGATGIVKHHRGQTIVLAFTMPILAGAYELALAEDAVEVLDERVPASEARKPRHRGGKRARRKREEGEADSAQ